MKNFKKILSWLCLIPGIVFMLYGLTLIFKDDVPDEVILVDDYCVHEENEGKYVAMVGTLHYDAKATDESFGVEFDSPAAVRVVSMYQVWRNGQDELEYGWSTIAHGSVRISGVTVHNGEMPDGLKLGKEYLTAPMTMEDGDLLIAPEASRSFCFEKYVNFSQSYDDGMVEVNDLPENDNKFGFFSTGSYYKSSDQEEVGTIRVSYRYFDMDRVQDQVFTISGIQENGCVKNTIFTDKAMTLEEIEAEYPKLHTGNWKTATVMGLIVLGLGVMGFFHYRKRS